MTTKAVLRSIKNVTSGYSSAQILVRNATSNDATGPTISQMQDVASHTNENGDFLEVMEMLDRRLNDKGKNWRHVAKALTLLEYLVRYGSDDVVIWAKDNLYIIKTLREFQNNDSTGHDQGAIIRVKAKELTSLLQDDERLKQERDAAQSESREGSRRRRRNRDRRSRDDGDDGDDGDDIYDPDLQKALEESRMTAEEEERRRRNQSDESLDRAIQLSLEEQEMKKKNENLLDLDNNQAPDIFGYYNQQQQQPQQGQIIGYDMFGNPVYGNQPLETGYLQNAYQDQATQQQLAAQQQQQQLATQQAAAEQAALQQFYLQQQQLYQQQLAAAQLQQQQQISLQTGSNNPFAMGQQQNNNLQKPSLQELQQQQQQAADALAALQQQQIPMKQTLTGSQKLTEQYSELNQLLAQGTGIDTFGNAGETRIPAQFTKTGTFINSQGTGYRQVNPSSGNPFSDTQFNGMQSSGIVPAHTGYGFGNQPQSNKQGGSLIDL